MIVYLNSRDILTRSILLLKQLNNNLMLILLRLNVKLNPGWLSSSRAQPIHYFTSTQTSRKRKFSIDLFDMLKIMKKLIRRFTHQAESLRL